MHQPAAAASINSTASSMAATINAPSYAYAMPCIRPTATIEPAQAKAFAPGSPTPGSNGQPASGSQHQRQPTSTPPPVPGVPCHAIHPPSASGIPTSGLCPWIPIPLPLHSSLAACRMRPIVPKQVNASCHRLTSHRVQLLIQSMCMCTWHLPGGHVGASWRSAPRAPLQLRPALLAWLSGLTCGPTPTASRTRGAGQARRAHAGAARSSKVQARAPLLPSKQADSN